MLQWQAAEWVECINFKFQAPTANTCCRCFFKGLYEWKNNFKKFKKIVKKLLTKAKKGSIIINVVKNNKTSYARVAELADAHV